MAPAVATQDVLGPVLVVRLERGCRPGVAITSGLRRGWCEPEREWSSELTYSVIDAWRYTLTPLSARSATRRPGRSAQHQDQRPVADLLRVERRRTGGGGDW